MTDKTTVLVVPTAMPGDLEYYARTVEALMGHGFKVAVPETEAYGDKRGGMLVDLDFADFERAVIGKISAEMGLPIDAVLCPYIRPAAPKFVEYTGSLVVRKNEKTKGSHPQPYYRKGRW